MLRGLLDQRHLLWGFVPLLAASVWAARSFARTQDRQFLARLTDGCREPDWGTAARDEAPEPPQIEETEKIAAPLREALQNARRLDLLDLPAGKPPASISWKKAVWLAAIFLGLAILARPEFSALAEFRFLAFGFCVAFCYATALPLLGLPEWLWNAPVSLQRIASLCALFPIPFRKVIGDQMRRDVRVALRVLPGLTVLTALAFQIAFSPPVVVAIGAALVLSFLVLLLLPLRWLRLALWALSNKPFRITRMGHGVLVAIVVCLFLLEAVFVTVAAYLVFGDLDLSAARYRTALLVAIPALLNGLLALAGTELTVRAYERARYDLVRERPKS